MTLRTASRSGFGSRCFFAKAVVPLACLVTEACSDSAEPKAALIDGGNAAADAAELPEGGNTQDAPGPPERIDASPPGPEAATPGTDGGAGDASEPVDGADAGDASRPGALGAACNDSSGCQSGHCSESVCCDTACDRLGQACNRQASEGTCTSMAVLHVDPNTGNDSFKGIEGAPLRTLSIAVRAAATVSSDAAPWRILLHDGTYSAATGELWPATVRTSVKIEAVNTGKAVLLAGAPSAALALEANVSVTGVVAKGFEAAFLAYKGSVEFERVEVDGGGGFVLTNGVVATIKNSNLRNLTRIGVLAQDLAKLTMSGGSVTADTNAVGCETAVGIQLSTDAKLTLDGVFVANFASAGLIASAARLDAVASTFESNGLPACDGAQIKVLDRAEPTFKGMTILNGKAAGIDVSGTSGGVNVPVVDSVLTNNYIGIAMHGYRGLSMRGSRITESFIGIYAPTEEDQVLLFLGEEGFPGNNVIRGSNHALVLMGVYKPLLLMHVEGNQWNPGVEGADAEGRYNPGRTFVSAQQPAGGNFFATWVKLDM